VIPVGTSVWIDFFSGRNLAHAARLEQFIQENDNLALCGIMRRERSAVNVRTSVLLEGCC